eukprot:g6354.t2
MVLQLAVLRGKRLASQAALPGIKDPFLLHPEARQVLLQLQDLLIDSRCSSCSWAVGASLLADLQVAVEGNFAAAEDTLRQAMQALKSGSAFKLELAAIRSTYAATRVAWHGGSLGSSIKDLEHSYDLVVGGWRECGKLPALPPLQDFLSKLCASNMAKRDEKSANLEPRACGAAISLKRAARRCLQCHDQVGLRGQDQAHRMKVFKRWVTSKQSITSFMIDIHSLANAAFLTIHPVDKEPAPAAARPAPRARRQTPPVDDGWGGQSLGDALAHKQATPSGGSTATGAGGSSSSSVRSGGQKSIPSGAGSADPGKSPEWIMNWVRSLPESHVPERTREHLADLIAESQMDGRFFSDYVQKVPPEVCAPKHAMKLKAAWSNVLKEAEVAEMAAACAVRPTQKGMLVAV